MTTDTALIRSREHLALNRRLILGHSLGAAFAGLVPVPYLDEWLPAAVKRQLVRKIAESRGVDLTDAAVRAVAEGEVPPPGWRNVILIPVARLARRTLRTALLAFSFYKRAEAASRTFALGTLFDHYCARIHVGGELDAAEARKLRKRIEAVAANASLPTWAVKRGFSAGLRVVARAPLALLESLRGARDDTEAEEIVEESLEVAEERGVLARASGVVEKQLSGVGQSYIDALVDAFERQP